MNNYIVFILAYIVAFPLFFGGCSLDPDRKLNRALELYLEKKPDALNKLEVEFLNRVSTHSFRMEHLQSNGSFLFTADEDEIKIVYPAKHSLTLPDSEGIMHYDSNDDSAIVSDGIRISIFDDGDRLADKTIGDKKSPVRSVLISNGSFLYYRNSTIYRYLIAGESSEEFLKETFPPPYAKYYKVSMYLKDDLLCILAGIAGSYYFSIVNPASEKIILKNLSLSSSKHVMADNFVFYIKGNSGNWELIRYDIGTKSKHMLSKFTSIIDIELTDRGYLIENSSGLWVSEYGGEKTRLPFAYQLVGTCRGMVLAHYKDSYYLIDTTLLFEMIKMLEGKAPELFEPGD
ncbi:MAG: hypothetical protein JW807_01210 [Spirochaetes bacterium]|nr:hypothetical protein [Spirochaetota bacterium]